MALVGIYGVMSHFVVSRRHEIGIRVVLGASPTRVFKAVMARALALTTAGLLIGLALGVALAQLLSNFLFGVAPTDAAFLIGAALLLAVTAGVACTVPAWRALHVDPVSALRNK